MPTAPSTRPRLGQLLLRSGAASRERLVEAWEQKVLFGDRLGTNLLALKAVSEETLARALGEQHDVPAAFGGNIDVVNAAVRRVPRSFAVERMVLPHHFESGTLFLLMRDPDDIVTRHDVYRMTQMVVVPVVVTEARMWSLLATHHKTQPSLRPIALGDAGDALFERAQERHDGDIVTLDVPVDEEAASELISESEFASLYLRSTTDEMRAVDIAEIEREVQRLAADRTSDVLDDTPVMVGELLKPIADGSPDFVMPSARSPSSSSSDATKEHAPVARARPTSDEGWVTKRTADTLDGIPEVPHAPAVDDRVADPLPKGESPEVSGFHRAPPAPVRPLSVDEANQRLAQASSRDALLEITLGVALARFKRVALFTVFPTTVVAWRAAGEGFTADTLAGYRVSLDERTVWKMVTESRAHYLGPLQTFRAHGEFVKRTGKKLPASIAVFPVLVGERVVNLVYGDNGHGAPVTSEVSELLIFTSRLTKAYLALLQAGR